MAANVETMFYTREKPWHGLGTMVREAPSASHALALAGLDWKVEQHPVQIKSGIRLEGFLANIRDTDSRVLGVVTDKYIKEEMCRISEGLQGMVDAIQNGEDVKGQIFRRVVNYEKNREWLKNMPYR